MAAAHYVVVVARLAEVQMLRNRQKVANYGIPRGHISIPAECCEPALIFASYPTGMTIRPNMYWTVFCFQTMLPAKGTRLFASLPVARARTFSQFVVASSSGEWFGA